MFPGVYKLSGIFALSVVFSLASLGSRAAGPVAAASDSFGAVNDIRIEGLQRVSAGSVFAALPIDIGDSVDARVISTAARAIFDTGNFQDIQIGIDAGVLVVTLQERPSISEINIEGNKAIETDALLDGLREQGMAEGRVFQRATLEGMRRELARQYSAQGRYDANIETDVTAKPRNRVAIDIVVDEGSVAKIKKINIVGNSVYDDKTLRELMQLKDKGWFTFITGAKKYAREKLSSDLETITDYYLDRGYIQFAMRSVQVAVAPTKDSVYITMNVDEGESFTIGKVELAGDVKDQAVLLQAVYQVAQGDTFSQARVTATEELMKRIMGNQGFAFAEVKSAPIVDDDEKTVDLTFFVEPGKRTYVRRIEFAGNYKTRDEVLRREMRQMEGGMASTELIEHSRVRLQRLGFFKEVEVDTPAVAGSDDLIDVKYTVEEQSSGSVSASVGVSQDVGVIFGADFKQNNFLGSGKQISIQANRSRFRTSYGFSYINPYYTEDGVSRGFNIFARETDFDEVNISSYSTNTYGGSVIYGYPLSETQSLRFSLGYSRTDIETGFAVVQEISGTPLPIPGFEPGVGRYIDAAADLDASANNFVYADAMVKDTFQSQFDASEKGFLDEHGDQFDNFTLTTSWRESTLNRGILATRGHSNNLGFEFSVPGSDLEYYRLTFNSQYFVPLSRYFTLRLRAELGYGDGYGSTEELPFFQHFFAGGFGSVRGFESNTLGPHSTPAQGYSLIPIAIDNTPGNDGDDINPADGNADGRVADTTQFVYFADSQGNLQSAALDDSDPFGGNILIEGSVELLFPVPFLKDQRSVRSAFFFDYGNVFSDNCRSTQINCTNVDFDELRYSVGIGLTWLSGFGPLSFSLGMPLNENDEDEKEVFQFSLGRSF